MYPPALFVTLISLAGAALGFELIHDYSGDHFFQGWDYYGKWDNLTLGNVTYLTQEAAVEQKLTYINTAGNAIIKVDNFTTVANGERRNSIRLTSQEFYDFGTVWVVDATHLPYGCSVWPAFWSTAPNWPDGGEIDIIEGINNQASNQWAIHTTQGCYHTQAPADQAGFNIDTDCSTASGCTVGTDAPNTYMSGFAAAGGGVYATQFDTTGIFMWFWTRDQVPEDLTSNATTLDVSTWGDPIASFPSDQECNVTQFFTPQQLIFDITLCGVWAGVPSIYNAQCPNAGPNNDCYLDDVVGDGSNYDEAYFEVSYVRTYATGTALAAAQSASATSTTSASATATHSDPSTTAKTQTSDASLPSVSLHGLLIFSMCVGGLIAGSVLPLL
ncbi:glycoside hydrolase family 16 protein [Daedalea quercina L-15889]|uniref:Glycoside hydrolase family 16 protein n=1 Tax=Daedalea quercina L-15889 TaxID=1314783 RepID=A0A165Q1Q0_9APHY|nr:glycoside hydrolase family 16 protein [Daedalea quercina L-15889]